MITRRQPYSNTPRWQEEWNVGRIEEDLLETEMRQYAMNKAMKLLSTTKLPLCGKCIGFHNQDVPCHEAIFPPIEMDEPFGPHGYAS